MALGQIWVLTKEHSQPGPARLSAGGGPPPPAPGGPLLPFVSGPGRGPARFVGPGPRRGLGRRGKERPCQRSQASLTLLSLTPRGACVGFLSTYGVLWDIRHSQDDQGAADSCRPWRV